MSLEKLCGFTGTPYDAVWPYLLALDPKELRDNREIQKTQLARYLRCDIFRLEEAPIPWIRERVRYLGRVMEMESEAARATED